MADAELGQRAEVVHASRSDARRWKRWVSISSQSFAGFVTKRMPGEIRFERAKAPKMPVGPNSKRRAPKSVSKRLFSPSFGSSSPEA